MDKDKLRNWTNYHKMHQWQIFNLECKCSSPYAKYGNKTKQSNKIKYLKKFNLLEYQRLLVY